MYINVYVFKGLSRSKVQSNVIFGIPIYETLYTCMLPIQTMGVRIQFNLVLFILRQIKTIIQRNLQHSDEPYMSQYLATIGRKTPL